MRALAFCVLILPLIACVASSNNQTPERPAASAARPADAASAAIVVGAPAPVLAPETEVPATVTSPDPRAADDPVAAIAPTIGAAPEKSNQASAVDASCRTDSDCAVKDVGSCCGYRPRCVNKDSPTFPEQVKAKCATQGRMGICGFPAIEGCHCDQGRCAAIGSAAPVH
jgi:hypothetical protein